MGEREPGGDVAGEGAGPVWKPKTVYNSTMVWRCIEGHWLPDDQMGDDLKMACSVCTELRTLREAMSKVRDALRNRSDLAPVTLGLVAMVDHIADGRLEAIADNENLQAAVFDTASKLQALDAKVESLRADKARVEGEAGVALRMKRVAESQVESLETHTECLEALLQQFVTEFESDFVVMGETGPAFIVDGPGERWGPIVPLYEAFRSALSAAAADSTARDGEGSTQETWQERDARLRHTPGELLAYALDDPAPEGDESL